ncbi:MULTISPECIES: type II toxin-antitoxin system HicB family antitoxin [Rhodomicrobium]|uniref:type II toxin-antitoxin system HicB family antitoxin n=1 Tax=Rhodomicrobium TaxID=1068 RepID=UPI000B4A689E|nr:MULTISPECIES: type II toxin-antitoxin system HicB family antitoxin [Rhodomicrobium]
MTVRHNYSVLLRPLSESDGGGWVAIVPDLPGCLSDGATPMEALENVGGAIEAWIAAARKHQHPIPRPDDFIDLTFSQALPDEMKRQAEQIARQMHNLQPWERPDQELLSAIYAEMARTTIRRAHLS